MMEPIAIAVVATRLLLPLLILRFPLVGVLLCALVDVYDYQFIGGYEWYQTVDKLLDIYYLSFAAFTVLRWQDVTAKYIALAAFAYRIAGLLVAYMTDQRWMLMVFPNLFEPLFVFYLLYVYIAKNHKLMVSKGLVVAVLASLLIPKLVQEYILHVYQPQPQLAPVWLQEVMQQAEQMAWIGIPLYLLPPAIVMLYAVLKLRKQKGATLP